MFNQTKTSTTPLTERENEDYGTDDRIPEEPENLYAELKSSKAEAEEVINNNNILLPQSSVPNKSHEKYKNKSMESRKLSHEKLVKNPVNTRTASDVKRKKLEVELRAAEELARLKETVIEKRLALELANLQDSFECHPLRTNMPQQLPPPAPPPPPPPPGFHYSPSTLHQSESPHYLTKRRHQLSENSAPQEREFADHCNRLTTRAPLISVSSGHSRQSSPIAGKLFKTDSTSSILSSIRNLNLIDKKFSMDKKHSLHGEIKTLSPMHLPPAPRSPSYREGRYKTPDRSPFYSKTNSMYNVPEIIPQQSKAKTFWKSAMSKIKKKIKLPKQSEPESEPPSPPIPEFSRKK